MRIAITGATGLLGRNLLFEILKNHLPELDGIDLFVLGRDRDGQALGDRLAGIIADDGSAYLGVHPLRAAGLWERVRPRLHPVHCDLDRPGLDLSGEDYAHLREAPIDFFFHVAASTDLRDGPAVRAVLEQTNIRGTERVLRLLDALDVGCAVYVGSAYACGRVAGRIPPDRTDIAATFRSPYERSKLIAEIAFRRFAERRRMRYQVFRPSTLCGRWIERPVGAVSKFDVLYGWAAFFVRQKLNALGPRDDLCHVPFEFPVRIHVNPDAGQNLVPVDYCAKVICAESMRGGRATSYHVAATAETPHLAYIPWLLETIGIEGCTFVDEEPADKTPAESLYYRTVGRVFTPYVTSEPARFDLETLDASLRYGPGLCPPMRRDTFRRLMAYAQERGFGLLEQAVVAG